MNVMTSEHGVVTEAGSVRFERLLPGPIERVWAYLVDPDKRRLWLADGAMDARPGGAFEYVWRNSELAGNDDPVPEKYAAYAEHRMTGHVIDPATGSFESALLVGAAIAGTSAVLFLTLVRGPVGAR